MILLPEPRAGHRNKLIDLPHIWWRLSRIQFNVMQLFPPTTTVTITPLLTPLVVAYNPIRVHCTAAVLQWELHWRWWRYNPGPLWYIGLWHFCNPVCSFLHQFIRTTIVDYEENLQESQHSATGDKECAREALKVKLRWKALYAKSFYKNCTGFRQVIIHTPYYSHDYLKRKVGGDEEE